MRLAEALGMSDSKPSALRKKILMKDCQLAILNKTDYVNTHDCKGQVEQKDIEQFWMRRSTAGNSQLSTTAKFIPVVSV